MEYVPPALVFAVGLIFVIWLQEQADVPFWLLFFVTLSWAIVSSALFAGVVG